MEQAIELQASARNLLLDVLFNNSNKPDLLFHAVELIFDKFSDNGYYITNFYLDIESDLDLQIDITLTKPENYYYKEIRQFLIDLYTGLAVVRKCMTGFNIVYGKPTNIKVRELPNERLYPYDLNSLPEPSDEQAIS